VFVWPGDSRIRLACDHDQSSAPLAWSSRLCEYCSASAVSTVSASFGPASLSEWRRTSLPRTSSSEAAWAATVCS